MSIRTIVEINHDHLSDIGDPGQRNPGTVGDRLAFDLARLGESELIQNSKEGRYGAIRVLRQRHHSTPVTVKVE